MERESLVGGSGGTRRQAELMCWRRGCPAVMGLFVPLQRQSAESKPHSFIILLFRKLAEKIKKIVLQTFGVTNAPSLLSPEPCCRVGEWEMSGQQQVDRASGEAGFHLGQPTPTPSRVSSARTSSWLLKLQTLGSSGLSAGSASH